MTKEKVLARLKTRVEKYDTNREAAQALGVSQPYLYDVLRGKREPASTILSALGLEKVVSYREVKA